MIIQCEKCLSKFKLDDGLVTEEGRKVRCSQCKHVFTAFPPKDLPPGAEQMSMLDRKEPVEEGAESLSEEGEGTAVEEEGAEEADTEEAIPDEASPPEEVDKTESAATQKKKKRKTSFLRIVILIVLILLGAAVAIRLWVPSDLVPDYLRFLKPMEKVETPDAGIRRLSFVSVSGSFVESINNGNLFVIRGKVRNDYPKSRSFIRLKGTILDENEQPIRVKFGYAGNTFTEDVIKELPLEEMNQTMNDRFGMGKVNVNVAPGQAIPFTLVFENLPEDMSEFTVEAVSSSPGV